MPSTTGTFKLAWFISLSKLLFDNANRPRSRAYELRGLEQRHGRAQARLGHLMGDHHQPCVPAKAALEHRLDRHVLLAQHQRDGREHARTIGHLEVQVEGARDVLEQTQRKRRGRGEGGPRPHPHARAPPVITLTASPSTALAVCRPPAPGPDIVISVIASDSTVTALNGPETEDSGCPAYRNAGYTRTDSPPSRRSAVPISFRPSPSSRAYSRSSLCRCS